MTNESKLIFSATLLLVALLGFIAMTHKASIEREAGRERLMQGYMNAQ